jgi:Protein of unknown function (DUF3047)
MRRFTALVLALMLGNPACGESINFGPDLAAAGWSVVTFPGVAPATFKATSADTLDVVTDAAAGLLWHAIKEPKRAVGTAHWSWRVDRSVVPTDLSQRGNDDRALAVYFVFGRKSDLAMGPMALLSSSSVKALVYVFGGDRPRGSIVPSPHMGQRGRFLILWPANGPRHQWLDESIDIAVDYTRLFGHQPPDLLAVAISSDSDDTRGRNRAQVRGLRIGD